MRKSKIAIAVASIVMAATCTVALAACNNNDKPKSLRTQLATPTEITTNYEQGTLSFKAVENATYYRVYFYYIGEPDDDLGNTDYFEVEDEEESNTPATQADEPEQGGDNQQPEQGGDFPGGGGDNPPDFGGGFPGGGSSVNYKKDENGNYVLKSQAEILSMTPTYSKRYNAAYIDDEGNKVSYQAGETVTVELPNDSIRGGRYYVAVRAGGPIALYSLSESLVDTFDLVLKIVTPEVVADANSYSFTFNQYGSKETTNTTPMGTQTAYSVDTENTVLDGNGMMFEVLNASALYSANPSMELEYYITEAGSTEKVSFTYTTLKMQRNDGNTFCGWSDVNEITTATTTGKANISNFLYSHDGPTMFYAQTSFFYVKGLTVGTAYELHIVAPGDDGATSYDSEEYTFSFTYEYTSEDCYEKVSSGNQGGGPGGGFGGDEFPGGNEQQPGGGNENEQTPPNQNGDGDNPPIN